MANEVLIVGVSGSPRKGATAKAVRECLQAAQSVPGVRCETIDLAGRCIQPCTGCNACLRTGAPTCPVYKDDFEQKDIELFRQCDGIIVASPLYMMNPTGLLGNFFSRMRPQAGGGKRLAREGARVGGCIAVGGRRNGGQEVAIQAMSGMLQTYGTSVVGGDVLFYNGATVWSKNEKDYDDSLGTLELQILGRKVAYLAKIMAAGRQALQDELQDANYKGFLSREEELSAYHAMGLSYLAE